MISKAKIKFIKSLQIKKYRKQEQCFLVEGAKSVQELLRSDYSLVMLVGTPAFLLEVQRERNVPKAEIIEVSDRELQGLGEFQSNAAGLAVAGMKTNSPLTANAGEFALVLDDIRDPGNLGTIIRTADWYGIEKIIASEDTADLYNPKVISSSMGSFTRVNIYYTALQPFLSTVDQKIYGAFLDGKNVHKIKFRPGGYVIIGNESKGISASLEEFVTDRITIPRFGNAESLNAAIATAVICDNLRRDQKKD